MSPRNKLSGTIYVLENGCKWRFLPQIYGKSSTVHASFMRLRFMLTGTTHGIGIQDLLEMLDFQTVQKKLL